MKPEEKEDLMASLYEELVIAKGLIKEICAERNIPKPSASLKRIDAAIERAKNALK